MKIRNGYSGVAVAVALLSATPALGQERSCDNGRGALMTDLGFRPLSRSGGVISRDGSPQVSFASEPRITGVRGNGPAAGRLQEGDIVVAVDGHPITTKEGARLYADARPGERLRFSVRRNGNVQDVTITASARCVPHPPIPPEPPQASLPPVPPAPPVPPNPPADEMMPSGWFGFSIECRNCGKDESTGTFAFREAPMVVGVEPGSPAARAGLRAGDLLTHINGTLLVSEMGWPRFYAIQPGEQVRFTYTRDGQPHQITLFAVSRP